MTDPIVDDVVNRVGSRIRAEREDQGLTVTQLSERSGVGRGTVSDLERTARIPTLETLSKIASGLGVQMPDLLGEGPPTRPLEPLTGDLEVETLAVWVEGGAQVEVHRVRVTGPVRRRPGRKNARGYVTVLAGHVSVGPAATPRALTVGGQASFAADLPHVFLPVRGEASILLVMRYPST